MGQRTNSNYSSPNPPAAQSTCKCFQAQYGLMELHPSTDWAYPPVRVELCTDTRIHRDRLRQALDRDRPAGSHVDHRSQPTRETDVAIGLVQDGGCDHVYAYAKCLMCSTSRSARPPDVTVHEGTAIGLELAGGAGRDNPTAAHQVRAVRDIEG